MGKAVNVFVPQPDDELRAAVERVRRWKAGEWLSTIYPGRPDRSAEVAALEVDWRDVSLAYLADHPADSDALVTEDWVRRVIPETGGADGDGYSEGEAAGTVLPLSWVARPGEFVLYVGAGGIDHGAMTRRQFCRLAEGLGVTLKEGTTDGRD